MCLTWWAGCGTWHCRCQCTGDRWSLCQGSCLWSTSSCPDRSSDTACNIWNNNYLHPIVRQVTIISPLDQLILNRTASGCQVLLVGKTDYNLAGAGRLVQSTLLDPGSVPFEISIFYLRSSGKMGRGLPPFSVGQTPIFLLILVWHRASHTLLYLGTVSTFCPADWIYEILIMDLIFSYQMCP